jgi:HlyD family secretion protein
VGHWKHLAIAGGIVLALAFAAATALYLLRDEATEGILEASGQVRGTEVTVSSRLAGRIEELPIREGQTINKGELIAQIAASDLEARLEQAKAEARAAESRLSEAEAAVRALASAMEQAEIGVEVTQGASTHDIHQARETLKRGEAEVRAAQAQLDLEKSDYARYSKLVEDGFISRTYYDQVKARLKSSEARLEAAVRAREEAKAALERAGVGEGEVRLKQKEVERLTGEKQRLEAARLSAKNQAESAWARVKEIEAVLADSKLFAPVSATVVNKLAEAGELVVPGRPVAILIDLSDIYVRVFIPEKDLGKIRLGNPARINVDAFPDKFFPGRVIEIAQQAEFTPKEVHMKDERVKLVFGVKVKIENPEGHLKPGMPVDAKIKWKDEAQW